MAAAMPRQLRYFVPDIPQHVIQRGVDRQATFFQHRDFSRYLACLKRASQKYDCQIHAYVLMTNHTHLLITPGKERSLPLLMQAMGRQYVQPLNRHYERTGTLWEGRYKASIVQDDFYFLACQRYIELNPVRSAIVDGPGEYPYSSFGHNALGRPDSVLTPHPVYIALGANATERRKAYMQLFQDQLDPDLLTLIRSQTNDCRVLGDDRFKDQIESMIGRSVRRGKVGRPAKHPEQPRPVEK